jgi:hypothetical protein
MKRNLLIVVTALVLSSVAVAQTGPITGPGGTGPTGWAPADVKVQIVPNVAVTHPGGLVTITTPAMPGPFSGSIDFLVHANTQIVTMSVDVSHLYKDGVPNASEVIHVLSSAGVLVDVPGGNGVRQPIGTPNTPLLYGTSEVPVGIFQGLSSISGYWGSGDNSAFSETVLVTPTWNLETETPEGWYGGTVILYATVAPGGAPQPPTGP